MNNIIVSSLTLFLVFVTFSCGHASVVSIEIDLDSRKISCLLDKDDNSVTEITSIQLKGPQEDKIIASVDKDSTVTLNEDTKLHIMDADGKVDTCSCSNSYLYIQLADIHRSDIGSYACTVDYVNKDGVQKQTSTYETLNIALSVVSIEIDLASRKISCLLDKDDNSVEEITAIKLKGPQEDKIIASVDKDSTVTVNKDTKLHIMEADGKVDTCSCSNSYLYIQLADIHRSDFGSYACTVYYVNKDGVHKHTSTYETLNIASHGVNTDLDNTIDKIYALEKKIQNLTSEVRELEELSKTQRHRITELEEKGKIYAFTAYYDIKDTFGSGDVLLFTNVRINRGNAYRPSRGVFTAPKKGLYQFTVTITTESGGDEIWVTLYQNEEAVGLVFVSDKEVGGDQSSKTLLLQLSEGDLVKTTASGNTNVLENRKIYSLFSGFLVHAD